MDFLAEGAGVVEQDVMANASVVCVFSGCQQGVNEVFPILGCFAVLIDSWILMSWDGALVPKQW